MKTKIHTQGRTPGHTQNHNQRHAQRCAHLLRACVTTMTVLVLVLPGTAIPLTAQRSFTAPAAEREAVRQAILDYVEGIYDVAPDRIIRSVHPTLAKRGYQVPKDSARYHEYPMTHAQLVNVAKTFNAKRWIKPDAPKQIEVFEVLDQMASAKLRAIWGIDYFHLAKYDGRWLIVNVMWQAPPEEHPLYRRPTDDAAAALSSPRNDLAGLSDDFCSAQRLGEWKQLHEVEGWTSKLTTLDVNRTRAGALYLEPHTSGLHRALHVQGGGGRFHRDHAHACNLFHSGNRRADVARWWISVLN
jgi:hypothetical protein